MKYHKIISITCTVLLTLSRPIPLRLYTLLYLSNLPLLIFDIRALAGALSRASERPNVKKYNNVLDQYGVEPFEQQQFGTTGVDSVKRSKVKVTESK